MFLGGGTHPPANHISLQLDPNLVAQGDTRPGRQGTIHHQQVLTEFVLRIDTDESAYQVTGAARFFLVRGDSALIPADLVARGFGHDSARWYIERWEDEIVGPPAARAATRDGPAAPSLRAQPSGSTTWCEIKALYR